MKNSKSTRQHELVNSQYKSSNIVQSLLLNVFSVIFYGKSTLQPSYYRKRKS